MLLLPYRTATQVYSVAAFLISLVVSGTSARLVFDEQDLATCAADPATSDLLDRLRALEEKEKFWLFPVNPGLDDANNEDERFEWFSNVIPTQYSKWNIWKYPGIPPPPISFLPPTHQMFPFWNSQWQVSNWGYRKFAAFPHWVIAVLGNDPATYESASLRNSIFAKDLEDRGPNNRLKKQYMTALTCDKIHFYEPKIQAAVDKFVGDITQDGKPLMSSFYQHNLELYFDLHLDGPTGHPEYVTEYVELFMQLLHVDGDNYVQTRRDDWTRLTCLVPYVEDYFAERRQHILENNIQSTFVYWWDDAGIPVESVLFEAVHNILAWGQFAAALFQVLRAKLEGYIAIENVIDGLILDKKVDLIAKLGAASDFQERLDVAREAFRLLVPTQFVMSRVNTKPEGEDVKVLQDEDFEHTKSLLLPYFVQVLNDGYNPLFLTTKVAEYNTDRYRDFQPATACPFASGQFLNSSNLDEEFIASSVDGETIVPASHADYFPVFPTGRKPFLGLGEINGPKYCPFGLGYRRCPAEIFNLFYLQTILDGLAGLDFTIEGNRSLFDEPGPGEEGFDEAVPGGLNRLLDVIFVKP